MSISHLYNKTVSTYRPVDTVDSSGSPISTFYENLSSLACRVQENKGFEPVEGGRKFSTYSYVLFCDENTDILLKDVVLYNSETYNVVDIEFEGNKRTYLKITLEFTEANIFECDYNLGDQWFNIITPSPYLTSIPSLLVYNDKLYGGSSGINGGTLMSWSVGDADWFEEAPQLSSTGINALEDMDGVIYGGTTNGVLLSWSEMDGVIYGGTTEASSPHISQVISDIIAVDGVMYIGSGNGGFLDSWVPGQGVFTSLTGSQSLSVNGLTYLNGKIYAGTGEGKLVSYEIGVDTDWVVEAEPAFGQTSIYDLVLVDGVIYGGTGGIGDDTGCLFKWEEGDTEWSKVADGWGHDMKIFSLISICGLIFGTSGDGELLQWSEGDTVWTKVADQKDTQTRVLSLALYGDSLYGGTFNDGYLFRWGTA